MLNIPEKPFALEQNKILKDLNVNKDTGLSSDDVNKRQELFGKNILYQKKSKSAWHILLDQFKSLLTLLLGVAAFLSFIFGDIPECFAILIVIIINFLIGFFSELRAVRSMEALFKMTTFFTRVRRDGKIIEISVSELVPGDIVVFEGGDVIPADLYILRASKLQADESILTGESLPVDKLVAILSEDTSISDRQNMLFKGTSLTRGSGEGLVSATGLKTELGKIAEMVEKAKASEKTPLEKKLDKLSYHLIWVTLVITFIIIVTGILTGKPVLLMIETGIALAVATIPEGLPIVATIALARGMLRMARRNALINRLSAVETLGLINLICTDKTGTLTENKMTVVSYCFDGGETELDINTDTFHVEDNNNQGKILNEIIKVGLLCNNADISGEGSSIGDPLEISLLDVAKKFNLSQGEIKTKYPEEREEAFDAVTKMMATFHSEKEIAGYFVAVKGAPEEVLNSCGFIYTEDGIKELDREKSAFWHKKNDFLASKGLRMLAFAYKNTDYLRDNPYNDLVFLGIAGLLDPPRKDIKDAILQSKQAGIDVVMITGDHPSTAATIAKDVGIIDDVSGLVMHGKELNNFQEIADKNQDKLLNIKVFSRVTPQNKLDLINFYQQKKYIVAMTGDGVNDAPALQKADIGISMGIRGTQVAREASDMVLKDDSFSTIVKSIREGRVIFKNIRNFIFYLISCNISEVMIVSMAAFLNMPLPILPLQILLLNLVTDVFPALALSLGEGDADIMKHSPERYNEVILNKKHWVLMSVFGFIITISVLFSLFFASKVLEIKPENITTISFFTLAFAQLWHVFNIIDDDSGFFDNQIVKNPWVWISLIFCSVLMITLIYIPAVSDVLKLVNPGVNGWLTIIGFSLLPLLFGQILRNLKIKVLSLR